MAWTNCRVCWTQMQSCCGWSNLCTECKAVEQEKIRLQMQADAEERQRKIDAWEIQPVNIATLDTQFCECCGIPKNWCKCECKNKWTI